MTSRIIARVGWALAAVVVATWLALVQVFWLPLRVGGVPVPLSVLAAPVGNLLLVGLAYRLSGSRAVAVLPALAWLVVALAAMVRRPEGDLVLVGTGTLGVFGILFLIAGVVAGAFACGRLLGAVRPPAPVTDPTAPDPTVPDPTVPGTPR
ncbi:hypothetical protein [Blastococcus sp. CCUG 61487]|uniref:hypothetical protein n=1 Tax=Blastococcus sp. CCUG 61487 TaxID=1840703 RepID=UPI0010BFC6A8|nr:hypothetical protein [Blastococcus sp. CCUG 61487]TKJ19022.1 hypothetical protein A6V29_10675 [Blastococcus sp. CCUG 61487]